LNRSLGLKPAFRIDKQQVENFSSKTFIMCKIIGIDISKQTFDVGFKKDATWHHFELKNTKTGFMKLLKEVEDDDWIVMEASGPYYLQLALFFYKEHKNVCVLNPLIIRRYSQTRLYRAKTDKKDAQTIAEYGAQYELKHWKPETEEISNIKQLKKHSRDRKQNSYYVNCYHK